MPYAAARRIVLPPGSPRRQVPRWVGPLAAFVLMLLVLGLIGAAYWDVTRLRRQTAEITREIEAVKRENRQLRKEIRLLHTLEYVEQLARELLGFVKEGEIAVRPVEPAPSPKASPSPVPSPSPEPSR